MSTYPSVHKKTLKITVGCLVRGVVCVVVCCVVCVHVACVVCELCVVLVLVFGRGGVVCGV